MKETLVIGLAGRSEHTVTDDLCTAHAGAAVLATPRMIGVMEVVCMNALAPHLDEGETSVGVHVCVSHQAPARLGEQFTIEYALAAIDRRRLTYDIRITTDNAVISEGTHQRAVVRRAADS